MLYAEAGYHIPSTSVPLPVARLRGVDGACTSAAPTKLYDGGLSGDEFPVNGSRGVD